jgi:hypothetical protein
MKNLPLFSMLNQFTRQLEIPLVSQAQEALVLTFFLFRNKVLTPCARASTCAQRNASGLASRAMWSSTPFTNFASLPSG